MPKIVHFEIPADEPDRALSFYEQAFGWKATKMEGPQDYWLVTAGEKEEPGIDGAIGKREDFANLYPKQSPAVTTVIGVASVEESLKRIQDAGGAVLMPKSPIPGVGYAAYFQDSEGNVLGVFESDEAAE